MSKETVSNQSVFLRAIARSAKRVLAIVILSVCLSICLPQPGTDSSPGEIKTRFLPYDSLVSVYREQSSLMLKVLNTQICPKSLFQLQQNDDNLAIFYIALVCFRSSTL